VNMKWLLSLSAITFLSLWLFVAISDAQEVPSELVAFITNTEGDEIGTISFGEVTDEIIRNMDLPKETSRSILIMVRVEGLTPGFHGLHIHSVGVCEPSDERAFVSSGGHLALEGQRHPDHAGDLPSLLVLEDGVAVSMFVTDRFTLEDLVDLDGSAVIVHATADNFANIPVDRYDPLADEITLTTGDSGGRVACGVIAEAP